MAVDSDGVLRALIRLIPPARSLKEDVHKRIHLELFDGVGDAAVKSYQGLHASIVRLMDDPYLQSLAVGVPEGAGDKQKVSLVLMLVSQLLAYLEGQTGLAGIGEGGSHTEYNTAPRHVMDVSGVKPEALSKVMEAGANAIEAHTQAKQAGFR